MGNHSTKGEDVIIPRSQYSENIRKYEALQAALQRQEQICHQLQQQNEALQQKINDVQSQSDMKEKEKEALRAEVLKYESVPICKTILDVNEQITQLERDIKNYLNMDNNPNRELVEEVNKLRRSIHLLRQSMKDQYSLEIPGMKSEELDKLEGNLNNSVNSSRNDKMEDLKEMLQKLTELREKIPNSIKKASTAVEKDLVTHTAIFNDIRNDHVDVTYGRMKNILVEQENILLRHRLSMSTTVSGSSDEQHSIRKNNEDIRPYNLIFCNIIEEHVDQKSDYVKVREVLNYVTTIPTEDVRITRLGRTVSNKPRKIKATFPNTNSVSIILRNKHKLRASPFSEVRIFPDRPNPNS